MKFHETVWKTEGGKGNFTRKLLTNYCGLAEADENDSEKVEEKLEELRDQ